LKEEKTGGIEEDKAIKVSIKEKMREKLTEELKSKSWRDIKKFVDGEEVCR
jgi:hypothetical protein